LLPLVLLGALALAPAAEKTPTFRLTKADLGKLPAGWKSAQTGAGAASVWKVEADATAPSKSGLVLTQTAKSPRATFNLCVADAGTYQDVEVHVSFKSLRGRDDQGGGVVWRYQDAKNYYVCRFNPLEDNFRLYKVVDGKRRQIESAEPLSAKAGAWHTLSIKHQGDRIECSLNGKRNIQAKDDAIKGGGKVGLWTKADAVTSFDQFVVRDLGKRKGGE
jgi:hypothetical protein